MKSLIFHSSMPLKAENAGLFISQGIGRHPDRIIDSHELIFVRSGKLHIEEADKEFSIGKNETLFLNPHKRHRGISDYLHDLSFYWIHFRLPKRIRGKRLHIPQHSKPARPERLTELFRYFLDDQESGYKNPEKSAHLIMLMLLEILPTKGIPQESNVLASRAHDYIETNFRRGIHASDVTHTLGYHADYLGRTYHRIYGHTLSHAIHLCQVREARLLLRDSADHLEEVSRKCGFQNSRYFRKLFMAHQGMSPRAYRKLHARVYINTR